MTIASLHRRALLGLAAGITLGRIGTQRWATVVKASGFTLEE
ncbi:hypothetical protein [Variovorax guangxiensis]|nr:hypothetical protein [Variovorax guangxiensis]MDR6855653.1 hypothetical protein [Variovorax guangxiensis]